MVQYTHDMRIFYSELSANPSLYSFGYSVYAEREPSDSLSDCYSRGFLPFVGAKDQPRNLMYMGRGSRVSVPEFQEKHYHARVRRKVSALGAINSVLHPLESFELTPERISFILNYFHFRFGKDSMPEDRLRALFASGFLTHVREYQIEGTLAAYVLEVHGENFIHTWYHAYAKKAEGTHFGSYLYVDILSELKREGKDFLYFGLTYGRWMAYKTEFQPLSYWDGSVWVEDKNSTELKKLFDADSTRLLAFTDPWRDALTPYYKGLYPFKTLRAELRILALAMYGLPRVALLLAATLFVLFALLFLNLLGVV